MALVDSAGFLPRFSGFEFEYQDFNYDFVETHTQEILLDLFKNFKEDDFSANLDFNVQKFLSDIIVNESSLSSLAFLLSQKKESITEEIIMKIIQKVSPAQKVFLFLKILCLSESINLLNPELIKDESFVQLVILSKQLQNELIDYANSTSPRQLLQVLEVYCWFHSILFRFFQFKVSLSHQFDYIRHIKTVLQILDEKLLLSDSLPELFPKSMIRHFHIWSRVLFKVSKQKVNVETRETIISYLHQLYKLDPSTSNYFLSSLVKLTKLQKGEAKRSIIKKDQEDIIFQDVINLLGSNKFNTINSLIVLDNLYFPFTNKAPHLHDLPQKLLQHLTPKSLEDLEIVFHAVKLLRTINNQDQETQIIFMKLGYRLVVTALGFFFMCLYNSKIDINGTSSQVVHGIKNLRVLRGHLFQLSHFKSNHTKEKIENQFIICGLELPPNFQTLLNSKLVGRFDVNSFATENLNKNLPVFRKDITNFLDAIVDLSRVVSTSSSRLPKNIRLSRFIKTTVSSTDFLNQPSENLQSITTQYERQTRAIFRMLRGDNDDEEDDRISKIRGYMEERSIHYENEGKKAWFHLTSYESSLSIEEAITLDSDLPGDFGGNPNNYRSFYLGDSYCEDILDYVSASNPFSDYLAVLVFTEPESLRRINESDYHVFEQPDESWRRFVTLSWKGRDYCHELINQFPKFSAMMDYVKGPMSYEDDNGDRIVIEQESFTQLALKKVERLLEFNQHLTEVVVFRNLAFSE